MRKTWSLSFIFFKNNLFLFCKNNKLLFNKYLLNNNLLFLFKPINLKLRLKGKTMRWRRISKTQLNLKFGLFHPTITYFGLSSLFLIITKQKAILFCWNYKIIQRSTKLLIWWKKPNIYHCRGVRVLRTPLFKKFGKVSTYR